MSSETYLRLFGQAASLAIHTGNVIYLMTAMKNEKLLRDPEIKTMTSLQMQYYTVWNIFYQIAYFSLAFICDFLTVTGRDHMIPKSIRRFRHAFFSSVIWPTAMLISIVFWIVYVTNRELLYPEFIDKIFSFNCNLVMHFFIAPAALWELLLLPRTTPKSHLKNIGIFSAANALYITNVLYTYSQRGIWPYPVLNMVQEFGTSLIAPFFAINHLLGIVFYFLQWKLTSSVWGCHQQGQKNLKNK